MKKNIKILSLLGIFTAFSVAFLYIAVIFPTGQVGFIAVASLFGIAAVIDGGVGGGIMVFVASSILGLLLAPSVMTIYIPFFGYYPIIKALAEKTHSKIFEWIVKLAIFNAALAVMLFALSVTVFDFSFFRENKIILFLVLNIIFVIYDFGISRLIFFYTSRISPILRRK